MDQEKFYTVYRGKHSRLRYRAYMRLAKTHGARMLLEREGLWLRRLSVLDYGFGSGAFFLLCDRDCELFGLELDAVNAASVQAMLVRRGYPSVHLEAVDALESSAHPFFERKYDLVVLSHVLEHLDAPIGVLTRLGQCLEKGGCILGLLPLNERVPDDNHKWVCHRARLDEWATTAGLRVRAYLETDHIGYLIQPILLSRGGIGRFAAQSASLALGLAASLLPPNLWFSLGRIMLAPLGAVPSQAIFLLEPNTGD